MSNYLVYGENWRGSFQRGEGFQYQTLFNFINADSSVKCSCDNVANLLVIDSNLESIYAIAFQLNGV